MPDPDAADSDPPRPTVFLSYASADRDAARLLRDALPAFGLEVWYDESELGGGEAWDQKIRRQIRECDYFMPLVSARTEGRLEGYFRREWRLAVERTLDMADDYRFLLPIVLDDTDQALARVPEKFLTVQWLRVPGGQPTPALESLCRRVASGNAMPAQPARSGSRRQASTQPAPPPLQQILQFPREEPGQKMRFWVEAAGWACRAAWLRFNRLPRWVRIAAAVWLCIALISHSTSPKHAASADLSPAQARKLNSGPLLAIPFAAPADDADALKVAGAAFAMAYGRVAMASHGRVSLAREPLSCDDLKAALERARENHSTYVLCGTVAAINGAQALTVKIATVADGSPIWSKSYPVAGADPAKIAMDVEAKIPPLVSD